MASQETIDELLNYYVGLLIIQYANQPKAMATIRLLAKALLANGVYLDVLNGYNIIGDDIAVGAQLDVIGKYVGINRNFPELILQNYMGAVTYSEHSSLPSSPPVFGLETYATFAGDYDYNGTLTYGDIITTNEQLTDAAFYTLIQLAIICNNMNYSMGAVDALLFEFFGTSIRAEYPSAMHWVYFVTTSLTPLIQAILYKGLLPVPIGVGAVVVTDVAAETFSATTYKQYAAGFTNPFGYGFSTYSNYASLSGNVLVYNQIVPVT
jgi:Protein of unknown function (DUF2612)